MGRVTGQCPLHGHWNIMIPTDTAEMCPVCWQQAATIERLTAENRELLEVFGHNYIDNYEFDGLCLQCGLGRQHPIHNSQAPRADKKDGTE